MTGFAADPAALVRRAARVQGCAADVAAAVPPLAGALAGSGLELTPVVGVLGGPLLAAELAARLLPLPGGLLGLAAALEALAAELLAAAASYAAVDAAAAAVGAAVRVEEQVATPLAALGLVVAWDAAHQLPAPLRPAGEAALGLADRALEGEPRVRRLAPSRLAAAGLGPAELAAGGRSVAAALGLVSGLSTPATPSTGVLLRTAAGPPPRFVLCLPGLQDWHGTDTSAADLPGAAATLTGHSAYISGAREVLDGLPRGSEVLLVGHSQGGMVAEALAADRGLSRSGVRVAALVTAGAPRLATDPLPGRPYLALENDLDPVPPLRGLVAGALLPPIGQPRDPDRVVVRFPAPRPGLTLANHVLDGDAAGYLAEAAGDDPRVAAFRRATARFWTGRATVAEVFQVTDAGPHLLP